MSNNPLCHRKLLPNRVDAGWLKGHDSGQSGHAQAGWARLIIGIVLLLYGAIGSTGRPAHQSP